jgi:hypothetical protein
MPTAQVLKPGLGIHASIGLGSDPSPRSIGLRSESEMARPSLVELLKDKRSDVMVVAPQ